VAKVRVPGVNDAVVGLAAAGSLWLTSVNHFQPVLDRVDPHTGRLLARLRPFAPDALVRGIASVGDALWVSVAATRGPTLIRVDTRNNRIALQTRPPIAGNPDAFPAVMAPGDGTLWLQTTPAALTQISPSTGRPLRQLRLPLDRSRPIEDYWGSTLAAGFGSYWATILPGQGGPGDPSKGALVRLDSTTR
jgi:hypothetical protein